MAWERIQAHAAAEREREVCGLLLGQAGHVSAVMPARNVAADPRRRFEIDPATLFAAIRAERAGGPKLLGSYHRPPTGSPEPSVADRETAAGDGKLWLIVAGAEIGVWRSGREGFEPVALELC